MPLSAKGYHGLGLDVEALKVFGQRSDHCPGVLRPSRRDKASCGYHFGLDPLHSAIAEADKLSHAIDANALA